MFNDLLFIRVLFVVVVAVVTLILQPVQSSGSLQVVWNGGIGVLLGVAIVLFEVRLKQVSLKRLIGAAIGSVLGILGAFLIAQVLDSAVASDETHNTVLFVQLVLMLVMTYVGLIVGANKGDMLNLSALGGLFGGEKSGKHSFKILDTSVIIDGRIADVAETGFLDGVIVIPQFVLRELQLVADSADSMKRNRGRRGLQEVQLHAELAFVSAVDDAHEPVRAVAPG